MSETPQALEESSVEKLILSRNDAKQLALSCRDKRDPYSRIRPSLLSAEHIEKYVLKTGLISPFYKDGVPKSRLKKASYEGRIGKKAYEFNEKNELNPVLIGDKALCVPANSIVFVECDLDFRLPPYIALRFNLQIRHVHRGLLLGTGPLVDPGYWGKLCIPLHNLTSEPYDIPLNEGLIWLEFTKTTSDSIDEGREPLADDPAYSETDGPGHWEIEDFLRKAAKPMIEGKPSIGIRSSIPMMVRSTEKMVQDAFNNSELARNVSQNALAAVNGVRNLGLVAAVGVIIGVVGLWASFYFGLSAEIASFRSNVDDNVVALRAALDQRGSDVAELKSASGVAIERYNQGQTRENELQQRLQKIEAELTSIRNEIQNSRRSNLNSSPVVQGEK